MAKQNILIVEDHALTRFGLRTAFEMEYTDEELCYVNKIFEAPNAKKGFEIIEKEKIDVVIMDLGLPEIDGIEATKTIKEKYPLTKVIVLSSHEKEEDVIKAIKAGAVAYCTKDIDQEKLVHIVATVVKGASWFDPKVAQYVLNAATGHNQTNKETINEPPKEEINLTTREKQILTYIVDGASNPEISKALNLSINTVKVHVCNILQKLSVADRTQAAIKAIKNKLV